MATSSHTYDVFLSFRDKDTRNNFTIKCLKKRGIHIFMDESNLKKGIAIALTLAKAIEESKLSLVVSQSKVIKEIVRDIMVEVKPASDIENPDCVVGIDTHLSKIESFSFSDINSEEVQMIGIYGVQGIGKSVLASDFYHKHKADFEYKSLAESINDKAKEKYQIVEVQKAILSEILGETDVPVYNVEKGAKMMEDSEKLARGCNWFGPGSRIIITRRKESLLRKHEVHFTYEMKAMDPTEALQLFSLHAFKRNEPHQYSRELTNAIVSYTKGIPSALVKLGSVLSSKYVSYQHCEVDGENKQVGEMRTLVQKKLNKMFKCGQWGADSTGRLDKHWNKF
ncbi:disease resistance protein Roq1-like [Castanea sativa]|uniref:disease resistance protein Roq1-like n=1 Tax=Castanea sativa TaxID=21020 RepID=UPI003F64B378